MFHNSTVSALILITLSIHCSLCPYTLEKFIIKQGEESSHAPAEDLRNAIIPQVIIIVE